MDHQYILFETKQQTAHIRLNRPQYRNAQSRVLLEELDAAFTEAVEDDAVKVIILSAMGDHFSAGHDLGTIDEKTDLEQRHDQ